MSAVAGLLQYLSALTYPPVMLGQLGGAWCYHPAGLFGVILPSGLFGAWLHERGSWIASLSFSRAPLQVHNYFLRPGYMSTAAGLLRYLSVGLPSGIFWAWLPSGRVIRGALVDKRSVLEELS